jgi:radical SAM superfamily enzyme YgiQ (UPF0313 family)
MAKARWRIKDYHKKLLAKETGAVVKEPGGRFNVALIYPNTYQVGLANLGLSVVYRLLNALPDVLCERVFLPDRQIAALYAKTGSPLLTLESSRPVAGFDLVLATFAFENDAPNLYAMLESAGLNGLAEKRQGPLVVCGGVAAMLNPEPLSKVVDGFLLGEAEEVLLDFVERLRRLEGLERPEILLKLAQSVKGFYAPRFYEPQYHDDGTLRAIDRLDEVPESIAAPVYKGPASGLAKGVFQAPGPEFGEMRLIEAGRGCQHGCRFCAAGYALRPPRLGRAEDFMAPALEEAGRGGQVGLVSAAVSDIPGVEELAAKVVEAGGRISVSSLRADRLSPGLAQCLAASRHQTVALAPEAGSDRLRRVINKNLSEEDLFSGVETLIKAGVPNIRLYFMVGLPDETEDDVEELIALVHRLRQQVVSHSRAKRRLGRVTVSLNAFIPKPFTPFQWEPMAPIKVIKSRMERVKKALNKVANLKVIHDVPKYAQLQAVLSRGDRRLTPLIAALASGLSPKRAYKETGIDPEFYAHRRRRYDEYLPWSLVDHRLSVEYLKSQAQRAHNQKTTPPCNPGKCSLCGACEQKT